MEIYKCEYCDNTFKSIRTINYHQKNAKFCLLKQKKQLICDYCNYVSFSDKDFESHKNNCVVYLKSKIEILSDENKDIQYFQNKIESYEKQLEDKTKLYEKQLAEKNEQIKYLQDQIISVHRTAISKPSHSTINNINNKINNMNILNLDNENIKNILTNNYNMDFIADGQKGVAKFAIEHVLKDSTGNLNYVCTDPSRKIFKYKNNLGEFEKDVNAQKLTNILTDNGIISLTAQLTADHCKNADNSVDYDKFLKLCPKNTEIISLNEDNTTFKNELATHTSI